MWGEHSSSSVDEEEEPDTSGFTKVLPRPTKLEAEHTRSFPHMTQFFLPDGDGIDVASEVDELRDFTR